MHNTRDFLIHYSIIFEHFSFLHHSIGSFFVRKLRSTFLNAKCIEQRDICKILIFVARKVSSAKITSLPKIYINFPKVSIILTSCAR